MKKFCISILVLAIIVLTGIGLAFPNDSVNQEYLRVHIRADSNDEKDQAVKYLVKDVVVQFLTPYVSQIHTKAQAEQTLNGLILDIEGVANAVLYQNGFNYKAKVEVTTEQFPTRVYQEFTLEQGYYDALIITLGSGSGDNWWCVVYPPLCFVGETTNYVYKSKIYEIIQNFKRDYKEE